MATSTCENLESAICQHGEVCPEGTDAVEVVFDNKDFFSRTDFGNHGAVRGNNLTVSAHRHTAVRSSRVALNHECLILQKSYPDHGSSSDRPAFRQRRSRGSATRLSGHTGRPVGRCVRDVFLS